MSQPTAVLKKKIHMIPCFEQLWCKTSNACVCFPAVSMLPHCLHLDRNVNFLSNFFWFALSIFSSFLLETTFELFRYL